MSEFGMFTAEGDQLVKRIAAAGEKIAAADGALDGWTWAHRELHKLAAAEGYEEATDTMVREIVYGDVVAAAEDSCEFYI